MKIKKILVSQPKPESGKSPYYDIAEKYKIKADLRPFIRVEAVSSKEFRTQKVSIPEHTAIVFTTRIGIDHYFRLIKELRIPISENTKYFCIAETVANYLQKYINYRKRKVFFGATGTLNDLFSVITKNSSEKFLFVLPEHNNDDILARLKESKLNYSIGFMYRSVSNDFTEEEEFNYDMLLFFSPQGVLALMKNFPEFDQGEIVIGCLGAATAQAVKDAGLRLDIEVPSAKYQSLSIAVDDYIKENHKRR